MKTSARIVQAKADVHNQGVAIRSSSHNPQDQRQGSQLGNCRVPRSHLLYLDVRHRWTQIIQNIQHNQRRK